MSLRTAIFGICLIFSVFQMNAQNTNTLNEEKNYAKTVSMNEGTDIVDIAASNENFATLVAAVTAAELVQTLKSEGPFTVFAPTNAAFAKLPAGTVETLLKAENKGQLAKILTYHVVAGKFTAKDVVNAIKSSGGNFTIETVSGNKLTAMLKDGGVFLMDENGSKIKVSATDIMASNGVIHVLDGVLLPK